MAIDTTKVANRRQLHFQTIEEIGNDVERLSQGQVKTLGNWSSGQILNHLAIVMNGSIDGAAFRMPWYLRVAGRLMKRFVLNRPMGPGFQLKGQTAAALVPPAMSWEEGLQKFRHAIHRLQTETKREPSAFLGPMTREDWDKLHCRHSELHLSFLVPANG